MTSLATSGRPHGRHLDFYVASSLSETVLPNLTNLTGLTYIPSDIFQQNEIVYFRKAFELADKPKKAIISTACDDVSAWSCC